MVARLALVLVVGLRPVPQAWTTSKRLAVNPAPDLLNLHAHRLVELIPFDTVLGEVILQLVIAVFGESRTNFLWLTVEHVNRRREASRGGWPLWDCCEYTRSAGKR